MRGVVGEIELRKGPLGDRDDKQKRGRNRKDGELGPPNPFYQSQRTKEDWDPGLSQTLEAVGITQALRPRTSMNLRPPGYKMGLAIICLILSTF